jgi:hypothetical protein
MKEIRTHHYFELGLGGGTPPEIAERMLGAG